MKLCPDDITIRLEKPEDKREIEKLHAAVFGPGRFARTAYRIREGALAPTGLARVIFTGRELVGSVQLTPIEIGSQVGATLLGPLAIAAEHTGMGHGRTLIAASLDAARKDGYALVILVGDRAYYETSGFEPVPPGQIQMPGPVDPARLLAAEL
ncbi:MAG: GNAT family N-acetyltransferase, partial [Methyloligellaceae bacterium]